MDFKTEYLAALFAVTGMSFVMAYRIDAPWWLGFVVGVGLTTFYVSIDILLMIISPYYRRKRRESHDR